MVIDESLNARIELLYPELERLELIFINSRWTVKAWIRTEKDYYYPVFSSTNLEASLQALERYFESVRPNLPTEPFKQTGPTSVNPEQIRILREDIARRDSENKLKRGREAVLSNSTGELLENWNSPELGSDMSEVEVKPTEDG